MRLGLFGGTFDPPHVGHLLVASDAFEGLRLDRLVFIPAATQPLKAGAPAAPAAERLAMVRLLVGGDHRFEVDPIEIERDGLSFTVDTLTTFAARHPTAERYLLLGADVLTSFERWREPDRIVSLARVVILRRVGAVGEGVAPAGAPEGAQYLESRRVDLSSTEVRARVRDGLSIHGFVPDAVAAHIRRVGLYR